MMQNEKPCRRATGRASKTSLLAGCDFENSSATIREIQAKHVARRARVPAAVARAIAELAFEDRRAWR